jgi:LysM repeat protein
MTAKRRSPLLSVMAFLFLVVAQPTAAKTVTPTSDLVYKVAAGDTLFSIARRFAISPKAIATINKLDDKAVLGVGKYLQIPSEGHDHGRAPHANGAVMPVLRTSLTSLKLRH